METGTSLFDRLGGREPLLKLLRHFYADVRQHQLLGPIFNRQIKDWPKHIEKIADFWSQVTGGPSGYGGGMAARHIPLGLGEEHFQSWLGLWDVNCRLWLSPECAAELSSLAQQIAVRLRQICGVSQPPQFNLSTVEFRPSKYTKP